VSAASVRRRLLHQVATRAEGGGGAPSAAAPWEQPSTSQDEDDGDDVLLELRDVHKAFGSKKILQGCSFKIRRGEAVGVIGASGTGKSTTLRLLAGLLTPDAVSQQSNPLPT
jgi:ABC-type glutathione transport system ATPase component